MINLNKKGMSLLQVFILIVGTMAFAFMLGSGIERVSAESEDCDLDCPGKCVGTTYYHNGKPVIGDSGCACDYQMEENSAKCGYKTPENDETPKEETPSYNQDNFIKSEDVNQDQAEEFMNEAGIEEGSSLYKKGLDYLKGATGAVVGEEFKDFLKKEWQKGTNGGADVTADSLKVAEMGNFRYWLTQPGGAFNVVEGGEVVYSAGSAWATFALAAAMAAGAGIGIAKIIEAYANERNARGMLEIGLGTGIVSAATVKLIGAHGSGAVASALAGMSATGIGLVAVAITAIAMGIYYGVTAKNFYREMIQYTPSLWQPSPNSNNCLECNALEYGCNEYQCKSFGPACEIINRGETDEKCVAMENDREPPIIQALDKVLKTDYEYRPINSAVPGEQGVKIFYKDSSDGCIPPFEDLTLGIEVTNKPAQCKIDLENKREFENMLGFMNRSSYIQEHILYIPGSASLSQESISALGGINKLQEEQKYQFFIKCRDYNGIASVHNFLMEFCVQDGPDTTPPKIKGTNYQDGAYIRTNQTQIPLQVITNEPATCKWDFKDTTYSQMENEMQDCSSDATDYISGYDFGCNTMLTGLKDGVKNTYYIRCQDKPWWNNTREGAQKANTESYILDLHGTNSLAISSLTINGEETGAIIKDSTAPVKVNLEAKTIGGAEEGYARCDYKGISEGYGSYNEFYNDGDLEYNYINTNADWLPAGEYNLMIRCRDKALNTAYQTINFTIEQDLEEPKVVRAYFRENKMNLITNEEAECVYSTVDANQDFTEGTKITSSDKLHHILPWNTQTDLYVKCKDTFGNLPDAGRTTITLRAYDEYEASDLTGEQNL